MFAICFLFLVSTPLLWLISSTKKQPQYPSVVVLSMNLKYAVCYAFPKRLAAVTSEEYDHLLEHEFEVTRLFLQ